MKGVGSCELGLGMMKTNQLN